MQKTPIQIAAVIFLVVGLAHLARLVFHFPVMIGGWVPPFWLNGVVGLLALALSFWLFKALRQ
ncbi:MAG: hypothetical protein HY609_00685 [Deltaproteobacteria bacterium]|nr:hypothetical protein [Deltaproteobacteria bacterium]